MRRIRPRLLALACAMAFVPLVAAAQEQGAIEGAVTDTTSGQPVPMTQIVVSGTSLGTLTNSQGHFRIEGVPAGAQTLEVRRIGYTTTTVGVTVTANATTTVQIALHTSPVQLEGLVVTALGIERAQRAVTNSVQQVSGPDLAKSGDMNVVSALSGKVSGVNITNSGTEGGSSRIVIRGETSVTGSNQPLFVVDGIPVNNVSSNGDVRGYGAIDYGNTIQDIDPSNIESISVLKGPNAAALYGSRAANGVVVITTKNGRDATGTGISASVNTTFESPLKLPTYQNKYGQGHNGQFEFVDGMGSGVNDNVDESWGPPLDQGLMIPQWWSNGQPEPWVSHPNNVREFFQTGVTTRTNAAFAKSSQNSNLRLSVSNLDQKGMYPGFKINRTTAALNGGVNLTDKLRADASVQYIDGTARDRPAQGYDGDNFMLQFIWFGRQIDMNKLRDYKNPDGTMRGWNYSYHDNPYWIALENSNTDQNNRIMGNASLTYDFTSWLTGTVRSGTDWSRVNRERDYAPEPLTLDFDPNGGFERADIVRRETNTDFLLTATHPLTSSLTLQATAGGNRRESKDQSASWYVQSLIVPRVYDLNNAAITPDLSDYTSRKRVNSLYGSAQLNYKDWLFGEVTGRNDWSSTLPTSNNSYFYPSVSGSFIFTDALHLGGPDKALSYGKLRASWSRVGSDADPYQLTSVYVADQPFGGVPMFGASNGIPSTDLKPELTNSWEVGTELRLFGDRVGLDATYYNEATSNQIIPVQVSPMTGYTSRVLNAGEITNKGVELLLNMTPVKLADSFQWDVTANFGANRSKVTELYGDQEALVLGTYYGVSVEAHRGEPYGSLYGVTYVRDGKGNIVVGSNGVPLKSKTISLLGNYQPDWTGGLRNSFRYKGLGLSVLVDTKQGGQIYSVSNNYGNKAGTFIQSLKGRETAESLADGGGMIVPGVKVTAAGDTVPNDIKVTAQTYWRGIDRLNEAYVYDASFIKLREVTLTYDLPQSMLARLRVSRASVALIGRNLWLHDHTPNIDPETAFDASNMQGIEYGQVPTPRSLGFSVSLTP
ncbi:MAG TPA: SusC/RagA family TonB-linked outer membrane protein [Gemmatimonadaceae bacterium]